MLQPKVQPAPFLSSQNSIAKPAVNGRLRFGLKRTPGADGPSQLSQRWERKRIFPLLQGKAPRGNRPLIALRLHWNFGPKRPLSRGIGATYGHSSNRSSRHPSRRWRLLRPSALARRPPPVASVLPPAHVRACNTWTQPLALAASRRASFCGEKIGSRLKIRCALPPRIFRLAASSMKGKS